MSYQLADGATTVQFVRPAHGLVALYGGDIVDVSVLGLKAGRVTHGHRFQGVQDIPIATAPMPTKKRWRRTGRSSPRSTRAAPKPNASCAPRPPNSAPRSARSPMSRRCWTK